MTIEQFSKLDKCFANFSMDMPCVEETIDAHLLLGGHRFDLYAILNYIDHKVRNCSDMAFAERVYRERTRSITGQSFAEIGNPNKQNFNDYLYCLDQLIEDFKNDNYDVERTFVPVDKDYILIDGAHRVACAAYFGKTIKVLRFTEHSEPDVSFGKMEETLLPVDVSAAMALESINWHNNLFMLFLWPKSFAMPEVQKNALSKIESSVEVIYEREMSMSYLAIRNLMIQIYGHMDWVGSVENDFAPINNKVDEVWDSSGKCRFILCRAKSCDYILDLKKQIREMFKIGLSSIHSTDNKFETSLAVNSLFNLNSLHFLHAATPTKFKNTYKLVEEFKRTILSSDANIENYIVDSSSVLALYGVREARDLDYYVDSEAACKCAFSNKAIEEHDVEQRQFYELPIDDLIRFSENYFVFNGIKFVTLEKLAAFKKKRYASTRVSKDKKDIRAINQLLKQNSYRFGLMKEKIMMDAKRRYRNLRKSYYAVRKTMVKKLHIKELMSKIFNK